MIMYFFFFFFFFFFKKSFLADTCPFFGATGTPCFWISGDVLLWVFKSQSGFLPYSLFFAEANVMYISPKIHLWCLHLPTSWRAGRAAGPLPHMHVQRWDLARFSNVRSHEQKTKRATIVPATRN